MQNIKFLLYLILTNQTICISKPFMVLKYHKNFTCHFCTPTAQKHKFIADFIFLDIISTAAVLQTHMESLKSTMVLVFFLMETNILLIHETKTTDATDDHCTASSDYGIPPTNNIYICNV